MRLGAPIAHGKSEAEFSGNRIHTTRDGRLALSRRTQLTIAIRASIDRHDEYARRKFQLPGIRSSGAAPGTPPGRSSFDGAPPGLGYIERSCPVGTHGERSPKSEGRNLQHHRHCGTGESGSALTRWNRAEWGFRKGSTLRPLAGSFGFRPSLGPRASVVRFGPSPLRPQALVHARAGGNVASGSTSRWISFSFW